MADKLKQLRDRAHLQLKAILKFAEEITENTTLEAITTRRDILETRYQTLNELELQLFDFENYKSIIDTVDEVYLKARELLTRACTAHGQREPNETHDLNATLEQFLDQQKSFYQGVNTSHHARLPKINIEPFSGDYKYWASFHDLYKSTVHDNKQISKVHKFQMLKGLLTGEASSLIRHIAITENNYVEAWDKLCNRYNKMTPIISTLIQTFFDQKPCAYTNGKELRRICETADEIIRGLRALGPSAETRDPWLIHILLGKIDNESKLMWANDSVSTDFPTFNQLIEFLNKWCDALEICDATIKKHTTKSNVKSFLTGNSNASIECTVCKQAHPLFRCPEFKNRSVESRQSYVSENDLCRNCLRKGHISAKCFSKASCLICNKRHHTLLHPEPCNKPSSSQVYVSHHGDNQLPTSTLQTQPTIEQTQIQKSQTNTHVLHTHYTSTTTVLPTAVIYIQTRTGKLQLFRALLDSGSQTSFVTESCAQRLGLQRSHSSIAIYGLASAPAGQTKGKIDLTIFSRLSESYKLTVTAHIIKNIANLLPIKPVNLPKSIEGLELADSQFFKPSKIDVLLGADVFFEILNAENRIIDGFPPLQSSKFGWLIAGNFSTQSNITNFHVSTDPIINSVNDDLYFQLRKFWEVEEIVSDSTTDVSSDVCEDLYEQTTTKNASGQFVVKLPFKTLRPVLGSSLKAAHQRLAAMERKYSRFPEFGEAYKTFIHEYIALGHMSYVPSNLIPEKDDEKYYLPHHAVVKPSSTTTKLRVVFDASCKTSTRVSLNDVLEVGPNLQTDLSKIMLKFRKHAIALVADIEKMYRQILVKPEDTDFQLILWRDDPNEPIKTYRLNTVTYGTACAPYLAVKTLKKSAEGFEELYPRATQVIKGEFYVDDLLTGCDNIKDSITLKEELSTILERSGFNLRKWKSNEQQFLDSFSQQDIENIPKLIEDGESIKTLGVLWNAESDTFSFKVHRDDDQIVWTKRKILSTASKSYDPLGWLAPTVILFKILLQKLWLLKTDWDESLPNNIIQSWTNIYESLPELEKICIPRRLTALHRPIRLQLHAFCDASEAAYGSVIYLRAINDIGEITVNIVFAKSKVAPIKQISLPRLELCGAVLLCKLVKFTIEALAYDEIEVFAWTDSMIVLHWLSDVPRRWKTFVGNRTAIILETVPRNRWQHVDSKSNPADAISRGVKPQSLASLELWWNGPRWLHEPELNWPKTVTTITNTDTTTLEERSKYLHVLTETTIEHDTVHNLLAKVSSWCKIRKIMVYVLRFGSPKRRRQWKINKIKSITPLDINDAEEILLRNVQRLAFPVELAMLDKKSTLPSKNVLSSLDPFIDDNGVLRVGGRLGRSSLPYSAKHPTILPKNHIVCDIIVRDIHVNHMHAGNSLTLSIVRNKYWMIGARYIIKRCIKACTRCIRYRFYKNEQKMADLPEARCNQSRPFSRTGLDYAGPLYIKQGKRKNAPIEKAYVAVFVCLAVKAVHLEVVSSLDTDSFLAALKRFISRRGSPEQIYCDNGSNFIGANNELQKLKHQITNQCNNPLIYEFLLQKSITFHFSPPHAPHFGGLWESTVKSFKYHLRRVTNTNLTFEEMTTLITQIEALLNSRPLCRINDDPTDLQVLTPAHFLVGESLTSIQEPSLEDLPQNKLSRWQNMQQRLQGFWNRWHRDYLTSLQQRYKWKNKTEQLEINDVVLIREDNLYPSQWLLGKVIAIHPGTDGITRVVTLKTSKTELKRPVNKLIKLPIY